MKGSYILIIKLENDKEIQIGKLGKIFFKKGFYAYVGSALNGLEQRINRHIRQEKKLYWHIDYFLKNSKINSIYYKEGNKKEECEISELFSNFKSISGFGCSDCNCRSHLFYGEINDILVISKSYSIFPFPNYKKTYRN